MNAFFLWNRVENPIFDKENQQKRLKEIEFAPGERARRLGPKKRVLLTNTEKTILESIPEYGIDLSQETGIIGRISTALVFAKSLYNRPISQHKAIINLIRSGHLKIVIGIDQNGYNREFIVKA